MEEQEKIKEAFYKLELEEIFEKIKDFPSIYRDPERFFEELKSKFKNHWNLE